LKNRNRGKGYEDQCKTGGNWVKSWMSGEEDKSRVAGIKAKMRDPIELKEKKT